MKPCKNNWYHAPLQNYHGRSKVPGEGPTLWNEAHGESSCSCLLFYFALSAQATLTSQPFNRPLERLYRLPGNVFSTDLPFHQFGNNELHTVSKWEHKHKSDPNFFSKYVHHLADEIIQIHAQYSSPKKPLPIVLMGISRGAWIAVQILSKLIQHDHQAKLFTLLFAPMTQIRDCEDTSLMHLKLPGDFASWVSIGNQDAMVLTERAFSLHQHLVDQHNQALHSRRRDSDAYPHHFICHPSIGYMGHGTSELAFEQGAQWLLSKINTLSSSS